VFNYLKNVISSLVYSERDIIATQFKRLNSVEEATMFPKELCKLINIYEITIDASNYEKFEHEYLPGLIKKLKDLQVRLNQQENLEIRIQEQMTREVIVAYKYRQAEIIEQQQKFLLNRIVPKSIAERDSNSYDPEGLQLSVKLST